MKLEAPTGWRVWWRERSCHMFLLSSNSRSSAMSPGCLETGRTCSRNFQICSSPGGAYIISKHILHETSGLLGSLRSDTCPSRSALCTGQEPPSCPQDLRDTPGHSHASQPPGLEGPPGMEQTTSTLTACSPKPGACTQRLLSPTHSGSGRGASPGRMNARGSFSGSVIVTAD